MTRYTAQTATEFYGNQAIAAMDNATAQNTLAIAYFTQAKVEISNEAKLYARQFATWRYALAMEQYAGIDVELVNVGDPYESLEAMRHDVLHAKRLFISGLYNTSTVFDPLCNSLVRAGHDLLDHVKPNRGFDIPSEVQGCRNVILDFEMWLIEPAQQGVISPDAVSQIRNALISEFGLHAIAGDWLGGYDKERNGFTFDQWVIDASNFEALLFGIE